jgi:exopolysaccharide production protein ExoZ
VDVQISGFQELDSGRYVRVGHNSRVLCQKVGEREARQMEQRSTEGRPSQAVNQTINSLQYGRALAALAVVVCHGANATGVFEGFPPLLKVTTDKGMLGVDFFFVLSGFIIMRAHMHDARTAQAATSYLRKRLTRIYIPYLPISVGLMFLYQTFPSISQSQRDWGVLTSLTLFPTGQPTALLIAWTLIHEMMFYCIFLASYFFKRIVFVVFVLIWAMAILVAWWFGWSLSAFPFFRYFFSPLNLEFIAGMASAYAYAQLSARWLLPLIIVGVVGIVSYFFAFSLLSRVGFGISVALIVIGVAMLERENSPPPIGWLLILGNASYAIYLVHYPIMAAAARLSLRLHSWELSMMFCVFAGTALGVAYHFWIEKPGLRIARGLFPHDGERAQTSY